MSRFRASSQTSNASSSPKIIPLQRAPNVNDILSFNSWNDDEKALETFCVGRNDEDVFEDGRVSDIQSAGIVQRQRTHSSPIPIVHSGSHTSTSSFELPDLNRPAIDSSMEATLNPDENNHLTLDGAMDSDMVYYNSMADWSMPNYPDMEPKEMKPASSEQSSYVNLTQDNIDLKDLVNEDFDPSSLLTTSWVDLPPVSDEDKLKLVRRDFEESLRLPKTGTSGSKPEKQHTRSRAGAISNVNTDHRDTMQKTPSNWEPVIPTLPVKTVTHSTNNKAVIDLAMEASESPELSATDSDDCDTRIAASRNGEALARNGEVSHQKPEYRRSFSSQARVVYPWAEVVNAEKMKMNNQDRTPPRTPERPKLREKFMAKFSTRSENNSENRQRPVASHTIASAGSNNSSQLRRVSLERTQGNGQYYTQPRRVNGNGLYPSLANTGYNVDTGETIKTKLQSAWNNVKYGWTMKAPTHFSEVKPLFMLGKCYHSKIDESLSHETPISSIDKFRQDFGSRIWLTYRREFVALAGPGGLTTDCGWGCMLRTGQMILAQAFVLHYLGRDWNWYCAQSSLTERHHRQIVRWFLDSPNSQCPFSLHNLVKYGTRGMGKKAGDWYGPASIAQILSRAMEDAPELNPALEDITVYVAPDCTLYIQDIIDQCTRPYRSKIMTQQNSPAPDPAPSDLTEDTWRSVVILIPVRLGGEALNSIYTPCLKNMLSQDWCLGIIGGRPKHSLYFVGWQDDKLVYLDPHYCQDSVSGNVRDFPLHTYHCMSPRKIPFSKMDPSCTIGFYCRTRRDFNQFVQYTREAVSPPLQKSPYPMFIFVDGRCSDVEKERNLIDCDEILEMHANSLITSTNSFPTANGASSAQANGSERSRSGTRTSEEFVFL